MLRLNVARWWNVPLVEEKYGKLGQAEGQCGRHYRCIADLYPAILSYLVRSTDVTYLHEDVIDYRHAVRSNLGMPSQVSHGGA